MIQNADRVRGRSIRHALAPSGWQIALCIGLLSLIAEDNPLSPEVNMLRAAYRGSDPEDSHPNEKANQTIGPQLADFFARAAQARGK